MTVVEATQGTSGPASGPTGVVATSALNAIDVRISNLTTYCSPQPSFTAAAAGDHVRLQLARAENVSRCFAPHALRVRISLPGRNNLRQVVLVGADGAELATATITSGG